MINTLELFLDNETLWYFGYVPSNQRNINRGYSECIHTDTLPYIKGPTSDREGPIQSITDRDHKLNRERLPEMGAKKFQYSSPAVCMMVLVVAVAIIFPAAAGDYQLLCYCIIYSI
jgi:hypothetical protein